MCLGALVMADVPHAVFAAHDANSGVRQMRNIEYVGRHIRTYEGGILEQESLDLIARYDRQLLAYITESA